MENKLKEAWSNMLGKLDAWLNDIVGAIPNFILAIVVFTVVLYISKYIDKLVSKILIRSKLQASMRHLISKLVSAVIVLFGLFLVLGILNLGTVLKTALAGAGVVGLAIGLALQGALANFYSGVVLSYVHFVKFGDWVESNGYEGEIVDIDLRSVTLKQVDNNLVYLPNKMVVEAPIKNYSTTSQSRVILNCGVHYDSDLKFVKDLVITTIYNEFEAVTSKQDVLFMYKEFADSSINFETRFWIESTSALEVAKAKSEAIIAIKAVFDANDINIPFPIRTLDFPDGFLNASPQEQSSEPNT
ncbi:mechanosensitive ion channel family protein [Formosa sediminum]|uniref:Mechanosensitive ion channel family protein n=1 Tax=Formosa sediminum TaxID=2594004 RepID=A0A516GPY8_9FLAO|nr:mechanosensitive ion channel family protein [Formosa sediminum]QDO93598.1 mechanosensitive ion channel family protein [Formosa sediminum]